MENRKYIAQVAFLSVFFDDSSDSDDSEEDDLVVYPLSLASSSLKWQNIPRERHRQKKYTRNVVSHFHLDEFKTFF